MKVINMTAVGWFLQSDPVRIYGENWAYGYKNNYCIPIQYAAL